jgi:hypothetical protein
MSPSARDVLRSVRRASSLYSRKQQADDRTGRSALLSFFGTLGTVAGTLLGATAGVMFDPSHGAWLGAALGAPLFMSLGLFSGNLLWNRVLSFFARSKSEEVDPELIVEEMYQSDLASIDALAGLSPEARVALQSQALNDKRIRLDKFREDRLNRLADPLGRDGVRYRVDIGSSDRGGTPGDDEVEVVTELPKYRRASNR